MRIIRFAYDPHWACLKSEWKKFLTNRQDNFCFICLHMKARLSVQADKTKAPNIRSELFPFFEVPSGFEPLCTVLQTGA